MNIRQFSLMRGYQTAYNLHGSPLLDLVVADPSSADLQPKLKRLQFDTSPALCDDVEAICQKLDCSKRTFLEMAVADAIKRANEAFDAALADATGADQPTPESV